MCVHANSNYCYTLLGQNERKRNDIRRIFTRRGDENKSRPFFFFFLIEYIVVSFRRFFVCGAAVHKNETDGENQQRRRIIYDAANTKQEKKLRLFEIIQIDLDLYMVYYIDGYVILIQSPRGTQ